MEGTIAQIIMFAGNFAPRGWAFCQGQIMSIAQNTALFSLLGTTYGGNGQTTFALPDLRGRVSVGPGQGPGLPNVDLGQVSGEANHTLTSTEMPAHNHSVSPGAYNGNLANIANPNGNVPGIGIAGTETVNMYSNSASNAALAPSTSSISGGSQPHNNMEPYLGMNFVICLEGIYPSRN